MTDNGFVGCLKNTLLRQVFVIPYIPFSVGPLYFERNMISKTTRVAPPLVKKKPKFQILIT